jgi:capsular polysaccharide biosynthesis protein
MDAATALAALRRGWFFVVIGGAVAAAAALLLTAASVPSYEASSTYVVSPPNGAGASDVAESIRTLDDPRSRAVVGTFVEVLSSATIQGRGAALAGLPPGTLDDYSVRAVVLPEANVVELAVRGPAPEVAAALSGAIGISAAETFIDLYRIYDVSMLDGAETPDSPAGRLAGQAPPNRLQARLASYGREPAAIITPLHRDQERRRTTRAG